MNGSDPNRILNECRRVDSETDALEQRQERLKQLQRAYIEDTSGNPAAAKTAEREADSIRADYQGLVQSMKRIKSDKESGNPRNSAQVGRVDRRVKGSLQKFMQVQRDYEANLKDRIRRDYLIVRPEASEAELREAEESSNTQVFSQALLSSDRRGQAQNVAQSVRSRHEAIQKIERDMQTIAAMFQDLDTLVVQQEAQVTRIEQTGEEVLDNANKGNTELDGAVKKARSARKKKWICLGIAGKSSCSPTLLSLSNCNLCPVFVPPFCLILLFCAFSGHFDRHSHNHWNYCCTQSAQDLCCNCTVTDQVMKQCSLSSSSLLSLWLSWK